MEPQIALVIHKLIFGGILCFLSIFLLSKTRDPEWMCIVTACILMYLFIVLEMLANFGLLPIQTARIHEAIEIANIAVPAVFLILAFIIKIYKSKR